jgi:tetratricopeptide (TPR) repeat protein
MLEERFFEARRHHEARRYWEALQIAEDLLRQAQGRLLRERLYLLRARCQAENPHWLHEAAAGLREALEEFPQSAEIHVELAALYKRAGLQQRASHELRAALRCDPQHTRAGAELKALSENPSGVFRGLRERLAVARAPAAR